MNPHSYEEMYDDAELTANGRLKPHAQVHLLSPTDKCKVCNEPAAKHVHYGAMTCFSCRAFFRRSIQNKTASTYVCRRSKTCEINLRTRKNCQYCRYGKCIGAGMKPSWVLSEDERQRRFRKNRDRGSNDQTSQSNQGMERNSQSELSQNYKADPQEEGLLSNLLEQHTLPPLVERQLSPQQNLHVVKSEDPNPTIEQTKVESIPMSSLSFTEQSYLALATPSTSSQQQAAILLYTTAAPHHQPASAVIVPATNYVSKVSASGSVTISTTTSVRNDSSGQASVIVKPLQRKTEVVEVKPELMPAATSVEVIATTVRSQVQSSVGYKLEEDADWDSNYEDDIFTSDEEEDQRAINSVLHNIEPEVKFTEDEFYHLESLVKAHNDKYRSVNFGEELIKEMIMCSMFGIPVSTSAAINGYRLTVERITRIAHNLECFTDLHKTDQSHLLMENADLLVNLRGAIFFDSRKKGVNQILISMGIDDMDTIKSMFTPLLKENSMKHIDYKTFNSIQAVANPAVETRYGTLQSKVAELLCGDDVVTVLTTYIILFSVDFCSLIDRRRVEQTQERFLRMLQRYIYSKIPRKIARVKLAQTLEMVTCLREMADIKKMRKINVNVKVP